MNKNLSKKLLQIMMCLLALAPLLTGILGLLGVHNPIYPSLNDSNQVLLDSNLRFLNGISVGIGVAVFFVIPDIERKTFSYRLIWGLIFMGSLGRLLSIFTLGLPPFPMPVFILVEFLGPPVFVYWHNQIAVKNFTNQKI